MCIIKLANKQMSMAIGAQGKAKKESTAVRGLLKENLFEEMLFKMLL